MRKYIETKGMKLSDRDRHWLMDLYLGIKKLEQCPPTILKKFLSRGLVEFKVTEEGKKAGFLESLNKI